MIKIYFKLLFVFLTLIVFGREIAQNAMKNIMSKRNQSKSHILRNNLIRLCLIVIGFWGTAQTQSLEFATGDGNPTATNGPVQSTSIRFRYNIDNPNGNTFQTYTPAVTASFQLTNQQYTLATMSSNRPVNIGHNNVDGVTPILRLHNSYGAPLSNWYTSNGATTGTGIDVNTNYGIMLGLLTSPLRAINAATSGTQYWMADLVVTFSQAVNDPILHLAGVGSSTDGTVTPSLGFSTEFDIVSSNTAVTLTKLSGTNALGITGTKINNTGAIMSSTGTDNSVSGSVRINGSGITTLTLRIYMRGDGRTNASTSWADTNTSLVSGDAMTLGFSLASPSSSCITSQPGSTPRNLCQNVTPAPLSVTATGATSYQWYYSDAADGGTITTVAGATSASYTPPTTATFATRYYFVTVETSCGTASTYPRTPVTVNANPTFTSNPAASTQTVCLNGTPTNLTVAAAAGNTYQWYSNTANSNTGGTLIAGATSGTFTPPTNVAGTTYYYAVITNTTTGCTATSNVRGVIVLPELTITTQPDSSPQNLCVNSTGPTLTVTATGATTYQWFYSNAATGGTLTTVTGATSASYTIPTTAAFATRYYYVTIGNGTCTVTSTPRTPVTVNANPTFTSNPAASTQTVCLNGTPTNLTVAAAAGNTYQWYSNTTNSNTGGTLISGATSGTFTPPTNVAGTTYYYAVITNTTTGCTAASNVRGVNVLPELAITTQPNSTPQNLCVNSIGTTLTVTATGATTYQWFYSNAATGGTLTTVTGATSSSYTIPTTAAFATRYYYVTVGNGTCTVTSSARTPVTVNANPTFTTNLTAGTQTVCINGTVTALTVAAAAGNTYQWYRNTTNSSVGGTPISGATSASYTPSSTTAGTTYYYAVITNTTTGCTAASNVRGVNVLPELAITTQPNSTPQNLCVNSSGVTLTVTATGATNYQWFYSNAATGGTLTTVTGATSASYTIPTTTAFATRYYYVTVGNGTCTVTSSPRTPVTVNANPTFTSNPAASSQTVCQNAATTSLSVAGTAVTYQWYSNTTNSNTGGTPIAGATSATFTPPSTIGGTTYYYAVINSTTTGCSTASNVRSVVVNGITVENLNAQTVCQNRPANTLGVITSPAATAYQWYYNTTNTNVGGTLIGGATTSTYIPPSNTLGTLYYFVQVTTAGCTVRSNTAQVNIVNTGCPDLSISCNPNLYLSQNNNTQLYLMDKSTNPFTYPPIGVASAIQYNGIGIDPVGGGMYGMKNGSRTLIKINNDGTYAELGDITGMPASTTISYNTGEFDDLGNYYATPVGSGITTMYKVNITTRTATTITLSQGLQISDLAYNVNDAKLYAVNIDGRTVSINPSTGVVTFIGPATGTVAFGAMFGSPNGIFGADNNGGFFRIDTVTGARFRISDSPSSGTNDGAHCVTAPITFDADLYVTKTDNTQFYTPGSNTVYTVVVGNNGPFGVQNATFTDAVPVGIPNANMTYTAIASSGSVTNITGTGTGAINDIVSLPVGGTVTYTVTIAIPLTFTGNLTNTATITAPASTSDTNLSNNTTTDTDTKAITACDPVVWYHTDDNRLYAADVNTGVSTLICDNFYTVDEGVFDIGYNTSGEMYSVNYNFTENKSYFYRFNTANCTFTKLTNTGSTDLSTGSNSLSFLPDGTALLGNNINSLIQRVTISGNNYTVSNWYNIVDPNATNAGGDFILFEGKVYASMINSSFENYIYELALDGSYNATGIQNIYADTSGLPEIMYGMAQVGGDIYGGFTDNTVRKITFSAGSMSLSANVLNAPTSGQVYGMSSLQEAFGVQTPVITSNPSAVNGTVTVCSTNPISVTLTSSLASNLQWYKDNIAIPGATLQTYTATALGSYTVAYTNTNGCLYTSDPIVISGGGNCACYKPGAITGGAILDTKVGITSLARAGETDADNWPMVRKGGWIALESKTKGLVVNRVAFNDADSNPSTPDVPVGIPSGDFVEGMIVYDTTNHCLKMYTSTDNGVNYHWYCISTQTCPD